jgi:two-component system repressor protein LuxO
MILARDFLKRFADEEKKAFRDFSDQAARMLETYTWPGNVRQLQNVIRNITVMNDGEIVTARMLPPGLLHDNLPGREKAALDLHNAGPGEGGRPHQNINEIRPLADREKEIIEAAIRATGGNIPQAASALRVSPSTIYRKISQWKKQNRPAGILEDGCERHDTQTSHNTNQAMTTSD